MAALRTLVLIFSKNRPLQLHACLTSLFTHVEGLDDVVVYHKGSPKEYQQVASEFKQTTFRVERQFYQDVQGFVSNAFYSHILFVVDDTVFIRPINLLTARQHLVRRTDLLGVTLRLGKNTTYCYTQKKSQTHSPLTQLDANWMVFEWTHHKSTGDFDYPLELSSTLYRLSDIRFIFSRLPMFHNPNLLEYHMDQFRLQHTEKARCYNKPLIGCPRISACVSIPMNLTQTQWQNRHANLPEYSVQSLLHKFQQGYRIDVTSLYYTTPKAAHQEYKFVFNIP